MRLAAVAAVVLAAPASSFAATGLITTVAGTGTAAAGGNGPATSTPIIAPKSVRATPDGGFLFVEEGAVGRVRKVSASGAVTTVAGNGTSGFSGDGGPATSAQLSVPSGAVQLADGSILIADSQNHRIRKVGTDGKISTVAGTTGGFSGDGGPATSAQLNFPFDVVTTSDGGYLIADTDNHRIRKVGADGKISTVAGTGVATSSGDGGAATAAQVNKPFGVDVYPNGDFLIGEWASGRVRKVTVADGKISRVAGGGATVSPPDGSPATSAQLAQIYRVAVMPDGSFVLADQATHRVRRVLASGAISTLAGTGTAGYNGEIAATSAQLNNPLGLSPTAEGDLLLADYSNARIRSVDLADPKPPIITPPIDTPPVITPAVDTPRPPNPTPTAPTILKSPTLSSILRGPTLSAGKTPVKSPVSLIMQTAPDPAASAVNYDLTGDKKADVVCPAEEPTFGMYPAEDFSGGVSAASVGGDTTSAFGDTQGFNFSTKGQTTNYTAYIRCTPDYEAMTATVPLPVCTQQSVVFGVVAAQGCMFHDVNARVTPVLPVGVRSMIDDFRAQRPDLSERMPLDGYWTLGKLELSGITITPNSGSAVFLSPQYERVVASNATVKVAGMTVKTGRIDLNLDTRGRMVWLPGFLPRSQTFVGAFTENATGRATIGGFRRSGQVSVALGAIDQSRFAQVTIQLRLPEFFSSFGSSGPASSATFSTSVGDPTMRGLTVRPAFASLGPVRFTDMEFRYEPDGNPLYGCSKNAWTGKATTYLAGPLGSGSGFDLSPNARYPKNGIFFCNGAFQEAGGRVDFTDPKPTLIPGTTVDNLSFGVGLDPPLLRGGASISVGGFTKVQGDLLAVAASSGSPYNLSAADGAPFGGVARRLTSPTVAVAGRTSVTVPVLGELGSASGYLLYSVPDFISLGGRFRVAPIPSVIDVTGQFDGSFSTITRKFDFSGSVGGCIGPGDPFRVCVGLYGWMSSNGVTVCSGPLSNTGVGVSYWWGSPVPKLWVPLLTGGCKPSATWETNVRGARAIAARAGATTAVRASARQAGGAVGFKVSPGEKLVNLEVTGKDGAPAVEIRSPDGEVVVADVDHKLAKGKTITAIHFPEGKTTSIGVANGKAGTYTITPVAGSAGIDRFAKSRASDHPPEGNVAKDGDQRVLSYDIGDKAPGEEVTFVELGSGSERIIGTAKRAEGTLKYTPGTGPAGQRTVVARSIVARQPFPDVEIAKYSVGSSLTAGTPGKVTVKRAGSGLKVSWKRAENVEVYGIRVVATDGTETLVEAPKGATKATVPNIAKEFGGKVEVSAKGPGGTYGKPSTAPFKATKQPINRFVPKLKPKGR